MNYSKYIINNIGNTPLLTLEDDFTLFVKSEFLNPSGSHKDRIYYYGINKLEKLGEIKKGMTLVDFSSGNGGASLALMSSIFGYKCIIVRPYGFSKGKKEQILNFGGEIVELEPGEGIDIAREKALDITERLNGKGYMMYQTDRDFNCEAMKILGKELVKDLEKEGFEPDYFICGVGTGGTISSVGQELKSVFNDIKVLGVDIEESPALYNKFYDKSLPFENHNVEGLSVGEVFENTDISVIDDVLLCDFESAWEEASLLGKIHSYWVGPSSGASFSVAKAINSRDPNKVIVTIFWDNGWKYIS